ncbi:hypothetical protein ACFJIX_18035 [Roseateles sp. UC29_93]
MKRLFLIAMCVCLAACGGGGNDEDEHVDARDPRCVEHPKLCE